MTSRTAFFVLAVLLAALAASLWVNPSVVSAAVEHHAVAQPGSSVVVASHPDSSPPTRFGDLPLYFEANRGQVDSQVKYFARGSRQLLFLTPTEAVLVLTTASGPVMASDRLPVERDANRRAVERAVARIRLVGAKSSPAITGVAELPGRANYFTGKDPTKWATGVSLYRRVEYRDVYPGIDLSFYGKEGQLEYDFVLAPGADPNVIKFALEGADEVRLEDDGSLTLAVQGRKVALRPPVTYQVEDFGKTPVVGRYSLGAGNEVAFEVAEYDRAKKLIIDPVIITYSTYLGGSDDDRGVDIALDSAGNAVVTGYTASLDFPTAAPIQGTGAGGYDVFVSKIDAAGTSLVYSTYIGGSGDDAGAGIAVDPAGNAYIVGHTDSVNFPTLAPAQGANAGGMDVFVAKLNAAGSTLLYSTYLGSSGYDVGEGIAVDPAGNAYIAGYTEATDFPVVNALQATSAGGSSDAFVAKLDATGSALVYSTYLGGTGADYGQGVAVDASGNVYITGYTHSGDVASYSAETTEDNLGDWNMGVIGSSWPRICGPRGSCFDPRHPIDFNIFVTEPVPTEGFAQLEIDSNDVDFAAGEIDSVYFNNVLVGTLVGYDGMRRWTTIPIDLSLVQDGANLVKITVGGDHYPSPDGGSCGLWCVEVFAGRLTLFSGGFPRANAFQDTFQGYSDAFVAKIDPSGSTLEYSTFLGGSGADQGTTVVVDDAGSAYVAGITESSDFPTASAAQPDKGWGKDAFVAKLDVTGSVLDYSTYIGGKGDERVFGGSLAVDDRRNAYLTGYTMALDFPTIHALYEAPVGFGAQVFVTKLDSTGSEFMFSTYLRGAVGGGQGNGIAVDGAENAYVTGYASSGFPTVNPIQATNAGGVDTFVTKLQTLCQTNADCDDADTWTTDACDAGDPQADGTDCVNAATVTWLDPFLCYKAKGPKQDIADVTLADDFDAGVYQVKTTKAFCAPADVAGAGKLDLDTHLTAYKVKGLHERLTNVDVGNELGTFFYDTKKADTLLVPSAKSLAPDPPPGPPNPASEVDHYRCVKAKTTKETPKFPNELKKAPVWVVDQVDQFWGRTLYLKRPTKICLAVDKNGEGIKHPDAHLVCYKVKSNPKHAAVGVQVNNQFGETVLELKKEDELCLPSAKN